MTVKELIEKLESMDQEAQIIIGVEGYTTETNEKLGVYETESGVYIADGCFYEQIDG